MIKCKEKNYGLDNIITYHDRAEKIEMTVDFVVSRAVAPMETIVNWVGDNISNKRITHLKNGFLCLKGGNLSKELKAFKKTNNRYF